MAQPQQKNVDYSVDIGAAPQVAQPNYGQLSSAYIQAGANIGQATVTEAKAMANLATTLVETGVETKKYYDVNQFEQSTKETLARVGTMSEVEAQRAQAPKGTVFAATSASEMTPTERAASDFEKAADRYVQPKNQGLLTASEAQTYIMAEAKRMIAEKPWAAAEIRKTAARLTGTENIESLLFKQALDQEQQVIKTQQEAAKRFETQAIKMYEDGQGSSSGMDPNQYLNKLRSDPAYAQEQFSIYGTRKQAQARATQTQAEVTRAASQGTLDSNTLSSAVDAKSTVFMTDMFNTLTGLIKERGLDKVDLTDINNQASQERILTEINGIANSEITAHFDSLRQYIMAANLPLAERDKLLESMDKRKETLSKSFQSLSGLSTVLDAAKQSKGNMEYMLKTVQASQAMVGLVGPGFLNLYESNKEEARRKYPEQFAAVERAYAVSKTMNPAIDITPIAKQANAENIVRKGGSADEAIRAAGDKEVVSTMRSIAPANIQILVDTYKTVGTRKTAEEQIADANTMAFQFTLLQVNTPKGRELLNKMTVGGDLEKALANMTPENADKVRNSVVDSMRRNVIYGPQSLLKEIARDYKVVYDAMKDSDTLPADLAKNPIMSISPDGSYTLQIPTTHPAIQARMALMSSNLGKNMDALKNYIVDANSVLKNITARTGEVDFAGEATQALFDTIQGLDVPTPAGLDKIAKAEKGAPTSEAPVTREEFAKAKEKAQGAPLAISPQEWSKLSPTTRDSLVAMGITDPTKPQQSFKSAGQSTLSKSENQAKFLDFLGKAEGADFNVIVGGKTFSDMSKHPSVVGLTTKEGPSTAAGKFQITKTTYDQYAKKLGITDFSPESQERIALAIIEDKGAMKDIEKGDFNAAIKKLGDVWASLPSSPYSQPKRSQEWVKQNLG